MMAILAYKNLVYVTSFVIKAIYLTKGHTTYQFFLIHSTYHGVFIIVVKPCCVEGLMEDRCIPDKHAQP